jgi:hypothetical protein
MLGQLRILRQNVPRVVMLAVGTVKHIGQYKFLSRLSEKIRLSNFREMLRFTDLKEMILIPMPLHVVQ